ncbi:MAG TPA: hypothetical protein VFG12_08185 [Rhodopila sp.]|jgi:hypothetical protein|nr:hypothetical protein [Rhodopila sp.]
MRRAIIALLFAFSPALAWADASIAGAWQADMGHGVIITMDILVDGHWNSETVQNNKVVAQMWGTYEQSPTDNTSGKLVFTPVKSKTSEEHGAATTEEDNYTLQKHGNVLRLVSDKQTMVFNKQTLEK